MPVKSSSEVCEAATAWFHQRQPMVLLCVVLIVVTLAYFLYQVYQIRKKEAKPEVFPDPSHFFSVMNNQIPALGANEPWPEVSFAMVMRDSCPACQMLYYPWAVLLQCLPIITKKDKNIPVIKIDVADHEEWVKKQGDKVTGLPTLLLLKGDRVDHVCEEFGLEQWVLFLKKHLPSYFEDIVAPMPPQEAVDSDSSHSSHSNTEEPADSVAPPSVSEPVSEPASEASSSSQQ